MRRAPAGWRSKPNFAGHQTFNICAPDTIMDIPTRELVARYLPQVSDLRSGLDGRSSGYSVGKAKRLLAFEAETVFGDLTVIHDCASDESAGRHVT